MVGVGIVVVGGGLEVVGFCVVAVVCVGVVDGIVRGVVVIAGLGVTVGLVEGYIGCTHGFSVGFIGFIGPGWCGFCIHGFCVHGL